MTGRSRLIASAVVGGLVLSVATAGVSGAQARRTSRSRSAALASIAPGSIHGVVQDERGAPVAGAMVSALGATTAFAVTDRAGRFELRHAVARSLSAFARIWRLRRVARADGRRARRARALVVDCDAARPSAARPLPMLAAGVGSASATRGSAARRPATRQPNRRHRRRRSTARLAWRLRHARRGVLKDATLPIDLLADGTGRDASRRRRFLGRAVGFAGAPRHELVRRHAVFGQVNLLTTGSFDTPQQLFTADISSRSIAYLSRRRAGRRSGRLDRARRADAGRYLVVDRRRRVHDARAGAPSLRHRPVVQHAALRRRQSAGAARRHRRQPQRRRRSTGSTPSPSTPALTVTYGARYARYDYSTARSLISPRVALTLSPAPTLRINAAVVAPRDSRPAPRNSCRRRDSGIWLPPQRTFSSLVRGRRSKPSARRTSTVGVERDFGRSTVVGPRVPPARRRSARDGVRRRPAGQPPAPVGHYSSATSATSTRGLTAGIRGPHRQSRPRLGRVLDDARAAAAPTPTISLLARARAVGRRGPTGTHSRRRRPRSKPRCRKPRRASSCSTA